MDVGNNCTYTLNCDSDPKTVKIVELTDQIYCPYCGCRIVVWGNIPKTPPVDENDKVNYYGGSGSKSTSDKIHFVKADGTTRICHIAEAYDSPAANLISEITLSDSKANCFWQRKHLIELLDNYT